jgi:hypothetical protein
MQPFIFSIEDDHTITIYLFILIFLRIIFIFVSHYNNNKKTLTQIHHKLNQNFC